MTSAQLCEVDLEKGIPRSYFDCEDGPAINSLMFLGLGLPPNISFRLYKQGIYLDTERFITAPIVFDDDFTHSKTAGDITVDLVFKENTGGRSFVLPEYREATKDDYSDFLKLVLSGELTGNPNIDGLTIVTRDKDITRQVMEIDGMLSENVKSLDDLPQLIRAQYLDKPVVILTCK